MATTPPRQFSCLENPIVTGAWWVTGHGVTKELGTTKVTVHMQLVWGRTQTYLFSQMSIKTQNNLCMEYPFLSTCDAGEDS